MLFHRSSCGASVPARLTAAALLSAFAIVADAAQAQTVTVASNTAAAIYGLGNEFAGTSFVTASGGPYNTLVFNLYSNAASTMPYAVGTAYLLSQTYTGDPADLNSSTAGYIASVAASNNLYTFSPNATLQGNTTYYFYENGTMDATSFFSASTVNQVYYANSSSGNYNTSGNSQLTFKLTGSAVSAPESASAALFLLPCLPIACGVVRRAVSRKRGSMG